MSFVRTLATLAAGYAAAKGVEKFQQMGGMAGLKEQMSKPGGGADQLGQMMEKMGIPGGSAKLQEMMAGFSGMPGASGSNPLGMLMGGGAGAAGIGGLFSALTGAGAAGAEHSASMMDAMLGSTQTTDMMEENAKLMIRAMIQAAKADGEIDAEERAKILEQLGEVSEEERAFVQEQLAAPIDVEALARDAAAMQKAQVYAVSAMAVRVDTQAEAAYLGHLAQALGLSPDMIRQIHASMGLPTA